MLFPMRPEVFDGIEFGGVGREPFELDGAVGRVDVIAHQMAAVRRESVPDDEQLALKLGAQLLEEGDDLRSTDRAGD